LDGAPGIGQLAEAVHTEPFIGAFNSPRFTTWLTASGRI